MDQVDTVPISDNSLPATRIAEILYFLKQHQPFSLAGIRLRFNCSDIQLVELISLRLITVADSEIQLHSEYEKALAAE